CPHADQPFLGCVLQGARVEGELDRLGDVRRRPAVGVPEEAVLLEPADIAPDRHLGYAELAGQLADPDRLLLRDLLQDPAPPVDGEHCGLVLPYVRRFTNFNTLTCWSVDTCLVGDVRYC